MTNCSINSTNPISDLFQNTSNENDCKKYSWQWFIKWHETSRLWMSFVMLVPLWWLGWIPGFLGFLNSAKKKWIWVKMRLILNRIIVLATFSLCWCFFNVMSRSPASSIVQQHLVTNTFVSNIVSNICHQHRCNPNKQWSPSYLNAKAESQVNELQSFINLKSYQSIILFILILIFLFKN